jgi:cytochrome oxidase Cu insertion factor (SCO1/SenC/PrrC family)
MPSPRRIIFASLTVAAAVIVGTVAWYSSALKHVPTSVGEAMVGGPFTMTDQDGRRVSEKDFLGKFMLVFFGYTYCPDVCPTELHVMSAAVAQLGKAADTIRLVFVTVDPERDTPEVVKSYVENFAGDMIGLTGSPEDVAAIAKAYRVYYQKTPIAGSTDYMMDHSSIVYLMGPDGKFVKHFTYSTDAKALADGIAAAVAR